jgi:hypothetical protein
VKPSIDTNKFREAIKAAFKKPEKPAKMKFSAGQGVELVPSDDREVMGEATISTHTVRHWGKWIYQKRENGKWDKLVPSPRKLIKNKK